MSVRVPTGFGRYGVEQPAFGLRLREVRRARGLSQAQVAGDHMSPSYVSLVESGRRTPNADVARAIANVLGVPLSELLETPESGARSPHRIELISRLLAARSARAGGDHRVAADQLRSLVAASASADNEDIMWEARWELAEALRLSDQTTERGELLTELLNDPLTVDSALLHTQVATALAEVARQNAALRESTRLAERAVAAAEHLDATQPERVRAQLQLVITYLYIGEWEQGRKVAYDLLQIVDDVPLRLLRGLVHWVAGAAAFLTAPETPDQTRDLFCRAVDLILPETDLRLWAQLCRATAAQHAAIGDHAEAKHSLQRARQSAELLTTEVDRTRLTAVEAMVALSSGDLDVAAEAAARLLPEQIDRLGVQDQAKVLMVVARVARSTGDDALAERSYQNAASRYEACGAYRFATRSWREATAYLSDVESLPESDVHALIMP
ncbi:helix-turn-helix domain-containing protein [Salinispora vitiensis]|uniref:helix-turn-helix domain-containing protein n=1 Tax=Salinispora vitiensis TaxID=999544 RepID=UPI0009B7C9EF|nr:helix-turn-helix domain-containing protein [Salinispora vitiensis]